MSSNFRFDPAENGGYCPHPAAHEPYAGTTGCAQSAPDSEHEAEIKDLRDRLAQMRKAIEYNEHLRHKLALRVSELEGERDKLAQANSVTAEGLLIERDELEARARRLDMRIKGLGHDPD